MLAEYLNQQGHTHTHKHTPFTAAPPTADTPTRVRNTIRADLPRAFSPPPAKSNYIITQLFI